MINKFIQPDPDDQSTAETLERMLSDALAPIAPDSGRSDEMRRRVLGRVRASQEYSRRFINVRRDEGVWRRLSEGVRVKILNDGFAGAVLVELEAGAALPMHRHHRHEECLVLRGEAQLDDLIVRAGDYHVAPPGSRHGRVSSRTGAIFYLRGAPIGNAAGIARDMVAAWLPGKGAAPITVRAEEGEWQDFLPGVQVKPLWDDGVERSLLLRVQPGACVPAHPHALDEECLMLDGEAYVGNTLLRAGEYQLAPAGTEHREVISDVGALLFVHGAADKGAHARI